MQAHQREHLRNHGVVATEAVLVADEREEQAAVAPTTDSKPACTATSNNNNINTSNCSTTKLGPARWRRRNGMLPPTTSNRTLLHMACESGIAEMATTLIKSGIDVNTTDQGGQTALHIAAQLGRTGCVRVLLGYSACLVDTPRKESILPSNNNNSSAEEGQTALQMAIDNQHMAVVYWLLYFGADPAMININNNNSNSSKRHHVSTITPAHALVNTAKCAIADTVATRGTDTVEQRTHRVRVALGYARLGSVCKHPKQALYASTGVPDVLMDETLATYIA